VGADGRVVATDVAPGMVELIRATVRGRPEITARLADAADTGLPSSSYDAVAFRMGLMLLPEPGLALAECRRVLSDGGRLGLAVWDGMQHNSWLVAVGMPAMMHGAVAGGPPNGPGGVFSLGDAEVLASLVCAAGFGDVDVQQVPTPARFATAEDHFDTVASLAGPLGAALAAAPPEMLAGVRRSAAEMIEPYRTDDGYLLPGQALLVTATA
jgi:SAM-dependent methyltransferase